MLTNIVAKKKYLNPRSKNLPWKQRLRHVTWAWFTLTMATGGIANVLNTGGQNQNEILRS